MIAFIEGELANRDQDKIIIKTESGLGYEVYTSDTSSLVGSKIQLYTSQVFRENSVEIFGFDSFNSKRFFELLLKVKGVGPKSAFAAISFLGAEGLFNAIKNEKKNIIKQVPGIGPKASAQIILDLKDNLKKNENLFLNAGNDENKMNANEIHSSYLEKAILAGKNLGFTEEIIIRTAKTLNQEDQYETPESYVKDLLKNAYGSKELN